MGVLQINSAQDELGDSVTADFNRLQGVNPRLLWNRTLTRTSRLQKTIVA